MAALDWVSDRVLDTVGKDLAEAGIVMEGGDMSIFEYQSHIVRFVTKMALLTICASVVLSLLAVYLSPPLYRTAFGYRNADECMIAAGSRYGVAACLRLYPRENDEK